MFASCVFGEKGEILLQTGVDILPCVGGRGEEAWQGGLGGGVFVEGSGNVEVVSVRHETPRIAEDFVFLLLVSLLVASFLDSEGEFVSHGLRNATDNLLLDGGVLFLW